MKQLTLATAGFDRYAKPTRRAGFLAEMEGVVPWPALCRLIEPHYPKPGNGRPPVGVERMLRIHFLQHWFTGSTCRTRRWKKRSTIRRRCGLLLALIWGASRCRMKRRCAGSRIFAKDRTWAASRLM